MRMMELIYWYIDLISHRLWRGPAGLACICLARFKSVASDLFDWARLYHRDAWGD